MDRDGRLLGVAGAPVAEALSSISDHHGCVTGELYGDEVELVTRVCRDGEDVAQCLGALRRRVWDADALAMATGLHPAGDSAQLAMGRSPRYGPIASELAGLIRTPLASLQVHVGLPDSDAAMVAYRALRNWLPLLRALGATSPFWFGQDSGLASARPAILRSYPRVSAPPPFTSYQQYEDTVGALVAAAGVPDYTHVWWDLRPHPKFGTLELRVMDAQWSLARVAAMTSLVQGLARFALETKPRPDLPAEILQYSDFRAWRYGLEAPQVGPDGTSQPVRLLGLAALREARASLAPDGLDAPLDELERMLAAPPESRRQRRLVEASGMAALVHDLVRRTMTATPGG